MSRSFNGLDYQYAPLSSLVLYFVALHLVRSRKKNNCVFSANQYTLCSQLTKRVKINPETAGRTAIEKYIAP